MKTTMKNANGFAITVELAEIWQGFGAERAARRAVALGAPEAEFCAEQLARSPASRRGADWKNELRSALLPFPVTGETRGNYIARARAVVSDLANPI